MPTVEGINDKVLVHDVKILSLESDMKEVKADVKNLSEVWRTIDSLTTNLNSLSQVVNKLSVDTNKSIQDVSELIRAQTFEFKESQKATNESFKKHETIISEIKNKPAYDALEQKNFWTRELTKKIFTGICVLLILGFGVYNYTRNIELQKQLVILQQK